MSEQRTLTVLAQDPAVRVGGRPLVATVRVPVEPLEPGPRGRSIHVVDYDSHTGRLFEPIDLDGPDRFAPADPRSLVHDRAFHAQNVYALAMSTLCRFERALGRRVSWGFRQSATATHQLKIVPHAFVDANAF